MQYFITRKQYQDMLDDYVEHYGKIPNYQEIIQYIINKKPAYVECPPKRKLNIGQIISNEELLDLLERFYVRIDTDLEAYRTNTVSFKKSMPVEREVFVKREFRNIQGGMHSHDYFEMQYVMKGNCKIFYMDKILTLKGGDFIIISPGSSHDILLDEKDAVVITLAFQRHLFDSVFSIFVMQNNLLADFFRETLYREDKKNYMMFIIEEKSVIETLIKNIVVESLSYDTYSGACIVSWLNLLFCALMRYHNDIEIYDRMEDAKAIYPMLQYIQKYYTTIRLEELVEQFHYSKQYICRLLKTYTGKTLKQLVRELRVQQAKNLLRETEWNISMIAERIGYSNAEQFAKDFHNMCGISPSIWRKQTASFQI